MPKVYKVTSTKKLMDDKQLADFENSLYVVEVPDEERKLVSKMNYQEEMDFLVAHEKRNKTISNLTAAQKGNTLVLYQYVENTVKYYIT